MSKNEIILVGGGGHCKAVIDIIELEDKFTIAGIIDKKELIGQYILGYKIIGCDDDLEKLFEKYKYAIVTVGQIKTNTLRVNLFNQLKDIGYNLPIIKSPLAYISKHSNIGDGTIIMHQALVNANTKIGNNCIINTKALIEHDCMIEDSCHISTACVINGGVVVKKDTFVGSNVTTKEYIEVDGFIKAGSLQK
ncbi:MAG: NeuD/PglB/VioB family sugar acetyltransferase [Arcobacteraceae bacterium]|nr:NeuD/PglB/VioB family sugar acetyltransferase [Arcobacteraceae bacterium]